MNQTTFNTVAVAPTRDPAPMIFSAPEPMRVRLRALTGNLFVATEVGELSGALTAGDLAAAREVFRLPFGQAEDFVVAKGDSLFAKGDGGGPLGFRVSVHLAPLFGEQEGPQIPQTRTKTMTVSQRIREIYTAPPQALVRLIFRNLGTLGGQDIALSEERANLLDPGGGYVVPVGVREQFILMPGQTLWGVALSVAPVAVSILPHASLTDGSLAVS